MLDSFKPGIYIDEVAVDCAIGPAPEERAVLQRILLQLFLEADLLEAGAADDLANSIDYRAAVDLIVAVATGSQFRTLEGLAYAVATHLGQAFPRIIATHISVLKPGVPGRARQVRVVLRVPA